jgi:hypothetical protein
MHPRSDQIRDRTMLLKVLFSFSYSLILPGNTAEAGFLEDTPRRDFSCGYGHGLRSLPKFYTLRFPFDLGFSLSHG